MEENERKINEWLHFQKELLQEKDLLTNLLSSIDKQIHALQVEQLHLLNTINIRNNSTNNTESTDQITSSPSTSGNTALKQQPLDLSVHPLMKFEEEHEEENSPDESDEEWQ